MPSWARTRLSEQPIAEVKRLVTPAILKRVDVSHTNAVIASNVLEWTLWRFAIYIAAAAATTRGNGR